jgi:hypothetical protein
LRTDKDYRRFLLAECREAYADLDPAQKQRLQELLATEQYREVKPIMQTTFERGLEQGERRSTLRFLEARFGPLSPEVKQRVEALPLEALAQLQVDVAKAQSLKELHLDE